MSKEFKANQNQKLDNQELNDWLDSLDAVVENHGRDGAKIILEKLEKRAKDLRVLYSPVPYSPYRNTISQYDQGIYPGDIAIEEKITAILRWNALAMVMKANKNYGGLGGHIASYASFAEVFEIGFNHFFKGGEDADLIFYDSTETELVRFDAGEARVGIKTSSPTAVLDVPVVLPLSPLPAEYPKNVLSPPSEY